MRAVKPLLQMIAAAAALALAVCAAPAAAEWEQPALTLETASNIEAGDTAVDAAGNGLVAWPTQQAGTYVALARRVPATGAPGPVLPLSDPAAGSALEIEMATMPGGDTMAVWRQGPFDANVVRARRISAAGELGPILDLSLAGPISQPRVAIDPSGFAYVVWARFVGDTHYEVEGRAVFADGGLGPTRAFTSGAPGAGAPRVAIGPDQNAFVTWVRSNPESQVQGKFVTGGGVPGGLLEIAGGAKQAQAPSLVARPDGSYVVVFVLGLGAPSFESLAQSRIVGPTGGLSEIADLSLQGKSVQKANVAAAPDGTVTAIWHYSPTTEGSRIDARRILPDGSRGPLLEAVASGEGSLSESEVGVDGAGNAAVVWSRENPMFEILTRRILADGTMPTGELVLAAPSPENPREAARPSLGVAANGAALLGFSRSGGGEATTQIQALRYLLPTPPPPDVAPVITGLRLAPKTFRVVGGGKSGKAKAAARRKKKPARAGSTIRFRASEPMRANFTVERRLPGKRAGKRCLKPGKAPRKAKRCARFVPVKGFRFNRRVAQAGQVATQFTGRAGKRRLKPGSYRLSATGVDAAGNRTEAINRAPFAVVRAAPARR